MRAKHIQRIFKEIEEVNGDFFNLRTTITPDPKDDASRFTFVMLPNDGAMAHLPLLGAFYIPDAYPESPPVVHLYTRTGRFNIDAYHSRAEGNVRDQSSLCFNILRAQSRKGFDSGTWTKNCTLSALFAALMSAIVSFYVPQEFGADRAEIVSMAALRQVKDNVNKACAKHQKILSAVIPRSPLVAAVRVKAKELDFPAEIIAAGQASGTVTAGPIFLQTGDQKDVYTFAVDLSELHDELVFSVILSNKRGDHLGRKPTTILVRNGVTATAARKREGEATQWFYHGKPMNDGDMRLHVTIGADQMTMSYYGDDSHPYVLGDCPVSRLTSREIGDVRKVPFWVHIYTKNTSKNSANIYTLETGGVGYMFPDAEDREFEFVEDPDKSGPLARKKAKGQNVHGEAAGSGPVKKDSEKCKTSAAKSGDGKTVAESDPARRIGKGAEKPGGKKKLARSGSLKRFKKGAEKLGEVDQMSAMLERAYLSE